MAPESDRIRYTRYKWNTIHTNDYIPYCAALSIKAMNYQDFVRTRLKLRYVCKTLYTLQ